MLAVPQVQHIQVHVVRFFLLGFGGYSICQ
jgi:hypothetical protein